MIDIRASDALFASSYHAPSLLVSAPPAPQDGPQQRWPPSAVAAAVSAAVQRLSADTLVTFDERGCSGHPNHVALYEGIRRGTEKRESATAGFYPFSSSVLPFQFYETPQGELPASLASAAVVCSALEREKPGTRFTLFLAILEQLLCALDVGSCTHRRAWVRGHPSAASGHATPPPLAPGLRCWALESCAPPLKFLGPAPAPFAAAATALGALHILFLCATGALSPCFRRACLCFSALLVVPASPVATAV